jgi:hypothetical protein
MSPGGRWILETKKSFVFLNTPCYETPKNSIKKIKGETNQSK